MDDVVLIGYAVTAVVVLGGFIGVIMKFTQPINDLRVVIQKLNDKIDSIIADANELKIISNKFSILKDVIIIRKLHVSKT